MALECVGKKGDGRSSERGRERKREKEMEMVPSFEPDLHQGTPQSLSHHKWDILAKCCERRARKREMVPESRTVMLSVPLLLLYEPRRSVNSKKACDNPFKLISLHRNRREREGIPWWRFYKWFHEHRLRKGDSTTQRVWMSEQRTVSTSHVTKYLIVVSCRTVVESSWPALTMTIENKRTR